MRSYIAAIWRCRYFWLSLVKNDLRTRYRRKYGGDHELLTRNGIAVRPDIPESHSFNDRGAWHIAMQVTNVNPPKK